MEMEVTRYLDKKKLNTERLDMDLRAALHTHYAGHRTVSDKLLLVISDDTPGAAIDIARMTVQTHDAANLTPKQEQEKAAAERLKQIQDKLLADPNDKDAQQEWLLLEVTRMVQALGAAGILPPQGRDQKTQRGDDHQRAKDGDGALNVGDALL
jgi:hypothetical protein